MKKKIGGVFSEMMKIFKKKTKHFVKEFILQNNAPFVQYILKKIKSNNNQPILFIFLQMGVDVEAKHPEKNAFFEAVINKLQDYSQYTVGKL